MVSFIIVTIPRVLGGKISHSLECQFGKGSRVQGASLGCALKWLRVKYQEVMEKITALKPDNPGLNAQIGMSSPVV